jgi:hypothetical protein
MMHCSEEAKCGRRTIAQGRTTQILGRVAPLTAIPSSPIGAKVAHVAQGRVTLGKVALILGRETSCQIAKNF